MSWLKFNFIICTYIVYLKHKTRCSNLKAIKEVVKLNQSSFYSTSSKGQWSSSSLPKMVRNILFGFGVTLLTVLGLVQCSYNISTRGFSPFRSDIAIAFFEEAQKQSENDLTSRDVSRKQCLRDINKIYEGIADLQEWALECKNKIVYQVKSNFFGGFYFLLILDLKKISFNN